MFKKLNFIGSAAIKILLALAADPVRGFYQREVAEEAGVSVGSANRILKILTNREIVTREKKGKIFLYKFNTKNPVAKQLKILFNVDDLDELVKELRDHCKHMILFGSCAEGSDVKESDVDLFMLTEEEDFVRRTIDHHAKKMKRRIAPIIVNANEFAKLRLKDRPLYDRVMGGIVLWQME